MTKLQSQIVCTAGMGKQQNYKNLKIDSIVRFYLTSTRTGFLPPIREMENVDRDGDAQPSSSPANLGGLISVPNSAMAGDMEAHWRCVLIDFLVFAFFERAKIHGILRRLSGLGTPSAFGGGAQPFTNLSSPPGWDAMIKATTTRVITVMDRQVSMGGR